MRPLVAAWAVAEWASAVESLQALHQMRALASEATLHHVRQELDTHLAIWGGISGMSDYPYTRAEMIHEARAYLTDHQPALELLLKEIE